MNQSFRQSLVPSSYDNRRRSRRPAPEIELSSRQQYRPPNAEQVSPHESNIPVLHGVNVDHSGVASSRRDISTTRPRTAPVLIPPRRGSHHHQLRQDNPAEDLAWNMCSHGCLCVQCVRTQEIGISENCGAFDEVIGPGLYCAVWPCSCIVSRLSLRVQQLDITIETKTKDDVFVFVTVSIHFRVLAERAYDAYYSLADTNLQIRTYVYDVIRSTIPRMDLDQVFSSKTGISDTIFSRLQSVMKRYGYEVVSTLVARITPNELVKVSMNEINASKRSKEAVPHRAEAEKIVKVKAAEAHAESLYLQGVGTAKQRSAIVQGLKSSLIECPKDQTPQEVMDWLLVTQYMDTLASVGAEQLVIRGAPREIFDIQKSLPKAQPKSPPDLLW